MKTGAQIVRNIRAAENGNIRLHLYEEYWPVIEDALLAYEPPSALRTILDRVERNGHDLPGEIAAARAELDALERK